MPTTLPATIELQTQSPTEVVDITARVEALAAGTPGGSCLLYLRHTTAGLMVMTWAAHFLSALVGPGVHVPVRDGKLALGEFQRIVLLEFEGPRRREIEVRLLAEA